MEKTNPSTSWLKVQNSDHWPQNGKQIWCGVCSTKEKPIEDLNVQSAKWCFMLTQIRFKCQNCNVRLCFDPCLRVFSHQINSETNTSEGKADYITASIIFHYVWILEYQ
jgi:hypothetical protein